MKATVQARLDEESQAALDRLVQRLGWSPSEVVRESLRLMVLHHEGAPKKRKIAGIGEFDSGVPDLGSNRKHLEGFGK